MDTSSSTMAQSQQTLVASQQTLVAHQQTLVASQQTLVAQQQTHLDEYIAQLNSIEKIVLQIAKEHLETSFSIEKSIGFKEWLKKNQIEEKK